jgi:hypothetical protein
MSVPEPVPDFALISQGNRLFLLEEAAAAVSLSALAMMRQLRKARLGRNGAIPGIHNGKFRLEPRSLLGQCLSKLPSKRPCPALAAHSIFMSL